MTQNSPKGSIFIKTFVHLQIVDSEFFDQIFFWQFIQKVFPPNFALLNQGAMPTRMRKEGRKMAMVAMNALKGPCTR
jgi:hypothetical protein